MHRPFTSLINLGIFSWFLVIFVVVYAWYVVRWIRSDEYMQPAQAVALLSIVLATAGLALITLRSAWSTITLTQIAVIMLGPLALIGATILAGWIWYRLIRMCAKKGDTPDA